ncbi:MAG: 3-hydroxyacyl-CoA dehydrogenase/enoyl-CoA hydratase family protein [Lautropia sp.]|nr:MAG: 3-hydroxyacyl-CoA dehydrogenase/enoyl-CoA hydratase family protein [Pseudomonadota bacterium]MBC6959048.1 3-hydroxyacyl-CoA dehydrogenase/enoyl-CoA hydratase family protein [Lautropia sp.]MDL1906310.1 3-hydroxyacyl-CoA dehydrogenase/enoyl-CoA hydratase family protein [Betaproteobacteria bacterium PRO1]RIK90255.1 MAG: 3-hydroxyacyl-CoA dehydrogenase [Burkholderiales bacterium]
MGNFIVKKAAVLGAGVMGAQIAAHLVNAQVDVVLFDLPAKDGPKNGIVAKAIEGLKKISPAPLGHPDLAAYIAPANYEDDLAKLRDCDLVIEAIAERMDWKHDLYRKVAPHLGPDAIFATNTSGLSIGRLAEGFDAQLRRRFCGVHFFNPPRYMHLVELIATPDTDPAIVGRLETFLTTTLGKGCVRAKDTPNFIANRIGTFGMFATVAEAAKAGLGFDVVDDLTGEKLGRAKSGTFRTADLVGLDTIGHVMKTMQDNLKDDPFAALYATPESFATLIARGALGQKTGAGFYRKEGKAVLRFDPARGDYVPAGARADETVARILKKKDPAERLKLLRESTNPQAQFVWAILRDSWHYAACKLGEIADNARDVDLAMRFGFAMAQGPFEAWQQAGWGQVADWIKADIDAGKALVDVPLPDWVFGGPVAQRGGVHQAEGSWSPTRGEFVPRAPHPVYQRQLFPVRLAGEHGESGHSGGNTVFEDESIRLWTLDGRGVDDVLVASIRTKVHAIGQGVIAGLLEGVELAERDYKGLVIWSPDDPFSYGADLQAMLPVFMSGGAAAIGEAEKALQDAMLKLRYAQVPTVAAVANMALGGGCELAMYCARRVAHLESYIGLVEVGVGLIPGGGGLAFGARRAAEEQAAAPDANLLDFLKKYVLAAGTAQVSRSAIEARAMGYLLAEDRIVFHRQELLYAAIREAKAMSDAGYRPPRRSTFRVAGRAGIATVSAQMLNMRDGGFISAHDYHLGRTIAEVMCGGEVDPGSLVDEEWLMALERKAFTSLLTHPKTQERIMGMMQTGKPVRN